MTQKEGSGSGSGALGIYTDLRSQPNDPTQQTAGVDSRKARFLLLAAAADLLPETRVQMCFRVVVPGCYGADVVYHPGRRKSRIVNLARCGLAACPVCGPWNRLQKGLLWAALIEQSDYKIAMGTFTLSHDRGESFRVVYDRLKAASKRAWSGRWYQGFKAKYHLAGRLTSLEVTHGQAAGFHPHYHIVFLSEKPIVPQIEKEMYADLAIRWRDSVGAVGGVASLDHGVDFQGGDSGAIGYLTKQDAPESGWGPVQEATLTDYKKGKNGNRSEMQLLFDYAAKGDRAAGRTWAEIQGGLAGQTRLKASRGLFVDLEGAALEDEQVIQWEEITEAEIVLMTIPQVSWRVIWKKRLLPEIYEIADSGDGDRLRKFLQMRGVPLV